MKKSKLLVWIISLYVLVHTAQSQAQVYPQISGADDEMYDLGYDAAGEFNFDRVQFDTYYGR